MRLLPLLVLAACSGSERSDATCARNADRLAAWVETLVAEGHAAFVDERHVTPVLVPEIAPASLAPLPTITARADSVSYAGQFLGDHATFAPESLTERFEVARELLAKDKLELALAVVVDHRVPWSTVATIGRAATSAGIAKLHFIFRGSTKLSDPLPSWIDAELPPLRPVFDPDGPAPALAAAVRRANDPTKRRVFDRCRAGRALLDGLDERAGETGNRATALASGVVAAYRECGCAEELGAVQRLMWELWDRGQSNMPHTEVVVGLDPAAPRLEYEPATPWSEAHAAILANAGRSVSF
jgi:hypothetical protein